MVEVTKYDTNNQFSWTEKTQTFDYVTGELTQDYVLFDNGLTSTDIYANGVRTIGILEDVAVDGGLFNWANKWTQYDETGAVIGVGIEYDNNVIQEDTYEYGVLLNSVRVDRLGDAEIWTRFDLMYGLDGQLVTKIIQFDDGIVRVQNFAEGSRTSTFDYDNPNEAGSGVKAWDRIETYFDATGQKSERATFYDNGIIKVQQYTEGQLTQLLQYDEADAASWDRIETTFSRSAGSVTKTTLTVGDDGVERVDVREDGKRASLVEIDASADGTARKWETNARQYDEAGQLAQQRITFDNTDQFVFLYADRAKTQKVEFDGDDSNAWVYRVTDYTADGPVVTTYDPGDAATPPEIIALFDDLGF